MYMHECSWFACLTAVYKSIASERRQERKLIADSHTSALCALPLPLNLSLLNIIVDYAVDPAPAWKIPEDRHQQTSIWGIGDKTIKHVLLCVHACQKSTKRKQAPALVVFGFLC